MTFVIGVLLILIYLLDGRWGLMALGSLLVVLAVAPARLRKVSGTGFSLEFQERVTSEIVVRTPRASASGGDTAVSEASIKAAAKALSEAASPEQFAHQLGDFLDLKWRDAPTIEAIPNLSPVVADVEYRAKYFGESAFLHLGRGQTGQLAVGYENVGTKSWIVGTASQADLVAPPGAPDNTVFAAGWLSHNRYATQYDKVVEPGGVAYFVYNVQVPEDAKPGVYRFRFRPENQNTVLVDDGGYQDVKVI